MKNEIAAVIQRHREEEKNARNEQLRARLLRDKSFEEMLFELENLKGLNKEERLPATA